MKQRKKICYVLANFGGPRSLEEIHSFLKELLLDPEVIRPQYPKIFHQILFRWVAKKRSKKVREDYEKIGGKSPIFEDTERLAELLQTRLEAPVFAFHRYLTKTHGSFRKKLENASCDEIQIFPLFPQFTYATTGSIARFLAKNLPQLLLQKIKWIKSYPGNVEFVQAQESLIRSFLEEKQLHEREVFFLFSCHGVPESFIEEGDPYESECRLSFQKVLEKFPHTPGILSYQSKFGPEEWIKPYTDEVCRQIETHAKGRKTVVIIPLSFTSDHIETLFEIEELYVPIIQNKGLQVYRCPALNLHPAWICGIISLLQKSHFVENHMLIRENS